MATKSKELLTVFGKIVADKLRKQGWKQKEYLSAGVIALSRLEASEQLKCKELAYSKENVNNETDLRIAINMLTYLVQNNAISYEDFMEEMKKLKKLAERNKPEADGQPSKKTESG